MGRYKKLNHTADLAIRVEAETIEDLFITFARAMFETIIEGETKQDEKINLNLSSEDLNELLMDWLRELLFLFETKGFIPNLMEVIIKKNNLIAKLAGDKFDPKRHIAQIEIKIPTYHQFQLRNKNGLWTGTILFDV